MLDESVEKDNKQNVSYHVGKCSEIITKFTEEISCYGDQEECLLAIKELREFKKSMNIFIGKLAERAVELNEFKPGDLISCDEYRSWQNETLKHHEKLSIGHVQVADYEAVIEYKMNKIKKDGAASLQSAGIYYPVRNIKKL